MLKLFLCCTIIHFEFEKKIILVNKSKNHGNNPIKHEIVGYYFYRIVYILIINI